MNYHGSDEYKTNLGSLCTIASYVVILLNLLLLVIAFEDKSKQEEKTQLTLIDRFTSDPYKLSDYNTEIAIQLSVPIPANIGRWRAYQNLGCSTYAPATYCAD